MRVIKKTLHPSGQLSDQYLLFDIETTGFHREKSLLYLIGCGYYDKGCFHSIQWFNDDGRSEQQILEAFARLLGRKSWKLFTFNGESFDIPFVDLRFGRCHIETRLGLMESLDLYRILRPFQQLYHMEHGSQKSWERFLDLNREDPYNGGDLIDIYRRYLLKGDLDDLASLLLHNEEDILGMLSLIPLLSYHRMVEDARMKILEVKPCDRGFPGFEEALHLRLGQSCRLPRPIRVDSPLGTVDGSDDRIDLFLPCINGVLRYYYPDYRNYYYLPDEDRAVHKSVGQFVDSGHRLQARASSCYIRKEGLFIPCPSAKKHYGIQVWDPDMDSFRRYYRDNLRFISLESLMVLEEADASWYLRNLIKEIYIASLSEETEKKKSC